MAFPRSSNSRVSRWIKEMLYEQETFTKLPRLGRKGFDGKSTGLPCNRWMAALFELNELRAIRFTQDVSQKPLCDEQIKFNWSQEFERHEKVGSRLPGGSISNGKWGIMMLRKKYRLATSYARQRKPLLMSFKYAKEGVILQDGRSAYKFATFSYCQELCIASKIADPRFFSVDQIEEIHRFALKKGNVDEWSIPLKEEIEELQTLIPIELYRCIRTYELWKKDPVPADFTPINSIEEEREEQKNTPPTQRPLRAHHK